MTQKLSDATLNTYYDYATNSSGVPTSYVRRSDLAFLVEQNSNLNLTSAFPSANANSGQSVFFQVPSGYSDNAAYANTSGLLNACGYFVEYGPNSNYWPNIFSPTLSTVHYRYRLMQSIQPTEYNDIYGDTETTAAEGGTFGSFPGTTWFAALSGTALPIADNIIALVIWPQSPASTITVSNDYQYSSRQGFPLSNSASAIQAVQSEQLPQLLQVTMVAIDASSATRLCTGSTPPPIIEGALTGLFRNSSTAQNAADLVTLQNALSAAHINYQVLTTTVTLRESKWSNGL
jgi:uncharacterized protein (TIGR02599 family)